MVTPMRKLSLVLLVMLLASSVSAAVPDQIVPYRQVGEHELSMHVFLPDGFAASDTRPAVVFFFGGGVNSSLL